jgi:hypothetical protein
MASPWRVGQPQVEGLPIHGGGLVVRLDRSLLKHWTVSDRQVD